MAEKIIINEGSMDKLISDIQQLTDNISLSFNDMSTLMDESSTYFNDDVSDKARVKFSELKASFPKIIEGLENFKEDFITCKKNYITQEASINLNNVEGSNINMVDTGVR